MAEQQYVDFDLQIERAAQGYHVEANGPAGQSSGTFMLPFSDLEIENVLLKLGHTGRGMRRIDSPEVAAAKTFGAQLFDAVFADDLRACLRSSLDEAGRQGAGLRIRLRLTNTPELADLPWEYLYHTASNRFLALSAETPLVRFLELPERIRPLAVTPPLRMLVLIASPRGVPPLEVEREWDKLQTSLRDLSARGLITLERIPATLAALQQQLRRNAYHILHFIGHGGFDERTQDGMLLFEDAERDSNRVSGQDLGMLLHDHRSLRFVMLNACEGARGSRTDPFAGTAQSLVQQGLPAVIAMQFEVSDEAAIALAREFYSALADSYPVDAALAEARKALFAAGNRVEWGTPVLYLRAPDGKIFDVAPPAVPNTSLSLITVTPPGDDTTSTQAEHSQKTSSTETLSASHEQAAALLARTPTTSDSAADAAEHQQLLQKNSARLVSPEQAAIETDNTQHSHQWFWAVWIASTLLGVVVGTLIITINATSPVITMIAAGMILVIQQSAFRWFVPSFQSLGPNWKASSALLALALLLSIGPLILVTSLLIICFPVAIWLRSGRSALQMPVPNDVALHLAPSAFPSGRRFWLRWFAGTVLGCIIGLILMAILFNILSPYGSIVAFGILVAVYSTLISAAQWYLIRPVVDRHGWKWIGTSAVCAVVIPLLRWENVFDKTTVLLVYPPVITSICTSLIFALRQRFGKGTSL